MNERAWFGLQALLFGALVSATLLHRRRVSTLTRVVGVGLLGAGAAVAVAGYRELGQSHSAWTAPQGDRVTRTGIYRAVRHPIYCGWLLGSLGFEVAVGSPLGVGLAGTLVVFYDLKSREEDRQLRVRFTEAAGYQASVKRFIPRVY
jgi:protein-S-isoprenylcysteine O-methyltransferase Ste14